MVYDVGFIKFMVYDVGAATATTEAAEPGHISSLATERSPQPTTTSRSAEKCHPTTGNTVVYLNILL